MEVVAEIEKNFRWAQKLTVNVDFQWQKIRTFHTSNYVYEHFQMT